MVSLEGSCPRTEDLIFILTTTTSLKVPTTRDQEGDFLVMPLLTIAARQHNGSAPHDAVLVVNFTYKLPRHGSVQANLLPAILNASLRGLQLTAIQQPLKSHPLIAGHVAGQLYGPIREALDSNGWLWSCNTGQQERGGKRDNE